MAAPDLETLLDFETNVENAAQTFLATDTGLSTSSINLTLDQDELELPRLEVRFDLGAALDPPDPKSTGSADLEYRKYSGTFSVMVMTRATLDGSETSHRSYRAKVRKSLLLNAQNFSDGVPDAMVVEGAGTAAANGAYLRDGDLNGLGKYTKAAPEGYIYTSPETAGSQWYIDDNTGSGSSIYSTPLLDPVETTPPESGWRVSAFDFGDEPVPTVRRATWADIASFGIDRSTVPILDGTEYLPYYDVNYLRPTGTDYSVDGDIAVSTLTFEMNLCIRNDAWPA